MCLVSHLYTRTGAGSAARYSARARGAISPYPLVCRGHQPRGVLAVHSARARAEPVGRRLLPNVVCRACFGGVDQAYRRGKPAGGSRCDVPPTEQPTECAHPRRSASRSLRHGFSNVALTQFVRAKCGMRLHRDRTSTPSPSRSGNRRHLHAGADRWLRPAKAKAVRVNGSSARSRHQGDRMAASSPPQPRLINRRGRCAGSSSQFSTRRFGDSAAVQRLSMCTPPGRPSR